MAKILLVEDDFALAMGTEYSLKAEGYTVSHAVSIDKAREALNSEPDINLILLDVMLPDGNGFDFCREIRQGGNLVPIIFLTAVGEEPNIVQGLELGADDYVTKPYRVKELMSRIGANLRRTQVKATTSYNNSDLDSICFGSHRFDVNAYRLYDNACAVELTAGELRLLHEFVRNEGIVITRSRLLEKLYDVGESFVDDNTLSVYVKRLRDKLGSDAECIKTVRGVGYRFCIKNES